MNLVHVEVVKNIRTATVKTNKFNFLLADLEKYCTFANSNLETKTNKLITKQFLLLW